MWASNYHTIFYKDGTVEHVGYRNKDIGTYKITGDNTIKANFDEYIAWAGEDYAYIGSYTVTYTYDSKKETLKQKIDEGNYNGNASSKNTLVKVKKMVEDSMEDY